MIINDYQMVRQRLLLPIGGEKNLILIMLDHKKREEILKEMDKPKNYSEYRNSLKKGGIISEASRGEIAFCLPHFEEYVRYYCS